MRSEKCDLLVIGSGAGAMSAALTASVEGLDVLIVEKEPVFGGATARSAGCLWLPANPINRAAGAVDSIEQADEYIRNETERRYNAARVTAFLRTGSEMLEFVQRNSPVRFGPLAGFPDYHCDTPGGSLDGRCVYPENLDGAVLGDRLALLRPVLRTSAFLGMQIGLHELGHFLGVTRSLRAFLHVTRALLRRAVDQLRAGRTLRLAAGNALVGGLASAAFGRGARLMVSAPALRLIKEGDRVTGAFVDTPQGPMRIEARRGVVIATGGFQHDSEVRARLFPTGATNPEVWGAFPYGNAGDGIRMGVEAGGVFDTDMKSPIALSPLTRLHSGEGVLEVAPVLFNFKMPGVIAVTRDGRRFVNESNSYHDFGVALLDKTRGEPEAVAWLICDHRALRRYGLGAVMPAPLPYRAQIRSGYLKRGATVRELAEEAGIDASGLEATIARFNEHARRGEDPEFGRGTNAFQRAGGDAGHKPNPCVAELARPPFYAVRVFAGSVGSFAGLKTDEHCRVVDEQGRAIAGLYAAGNDMASISGGDYIAGGITIGPAMTFGYIAARHAASAPSAGEQSPAAAAA